MSRIDEIKNAFNARVEQIAHRVQESDLYQRASERYQGLTPQGQRLATFVVIATMAALVLFSPLSSYFSSQDQISAFEAQRDLIKDLFKTYREVNKDAGISTPPPVDLMISQINSQLQTNMLLPEQIIGVTNASREGLLIPERFVRNVVHVSLAKLNLRQIVDIGNTLNRLSESVKMKDLVIAARSDMNGYFDVTYKMYALNVPEIQIAAPSEPEDSNDRRGSKKSDENSSESEDQ